VGARHFESAQHTCGNLMDAIDAWPARAASSRWFSFYHLGGLRGNRTGHALAGNGLVGQLGEARSQIQSRSLRAARRRIDERGDRDAADEIRYYAACGNARLKMDFLHLVWCPSICRRFRYWHLRLSGSLLVVGISLLARSILGREFKGCAMRTRVYLVLRRQPFRLLPVIEINQEFTEFFNDPKRERFDRLAKFYFFRDRHRGLFTRRDPGRRRLSLTQSS